MVYTKITHTHKRNRSLPEFISDLDLHMGQEEPTVYFSSKQYKPITHSFFFYSKLA